MEEVGKKFGVSNVTVYNILKPRKTYTGKAAPGIAKPREPAVRKEKLDLWPTNVRFDK